MSRGIVQQAVCSYGGTPPQKTSTAPVKSTHTPLDAVCRYAGTTQTVVSDVPPTG